MGYQESFVKFQDEQTLKEELRKYLSRKVEQVDYVEVACVDRVKKDVTPFKSGELVMVVTGYRQYQRSPELLKNHLGIDRVKEIVYIDNYYPQAKDGDLGAFLDSHFEKLSFHEALKEVE